MLSCCKRQTAIKIPHWCSEWYTGQVELYPVGTSCMIWFCSLLWTLSLAFIPTVMAILQLLGSKSILHYNCINLLNWTLVILQLRNWHFEEKNGFWYGRKEWRIADKKKKKKTGSVLMGEVVVLMTLVLSTVHLLILLHRVDSHRKVAFWSVLKNQIYSANRAV